MKRIWQEFTRRRIDQIDALHEKIDALNEKIDVNRYPIGAINTLLMALEDARYDYFAGRYDVRLSVDTFDLICLKKLAKWLARMPR